MRTVELSLIVPVYNSEQYVEKCVRSIQAQSYQNWELILVNDGSKDNSGAICDALAKDDERIRVIHKENGGASSARNLGIDHASGAFVTFVDADDWVGPDYCAHLMEEDLSKPMVICGFVNVFGQTMKPTKVDTKQSYSLLQFKNQYEDLKLQNNPVAKRYIRELIGEQRFDTQRAVSEDLLFNLDYYDKCDMITYLPYADYYYIANPNSAIHTFKEQYFSDFLAQYHRQKVFFSGEAGCNAEHYVNKVLCTNMFFLMRRLCCSKNANWRELLISWLNNEEFKGALQRRYPDMPIWHRIAVYLCRLGSPSLIKLFFVLKNKLVSLTES